MMIPLKYTVKLKRLGRGDTKMSVSLLEVLENAGYDIKNNIDDARWLLEQKEDFEVLCEEAENFDDAYTEYCYYEDEMREQDKFPLTFDEWRKEI